MRSTFYIVAGLLAMTFLSVNCISTNGSCLSGLKPDSLKPDKDSLKSSKTKDVPCLDELASDWMDVSTLRNFYPVTNFAGGLQTTQNLTAFQNMTFPPFAQGDGKHSFDESISTFNETENWSCEMLLDGKSIPTDSSRWFPYGVQRKVTINDVEMKSSLRLPFEKKGILLQLTLENKSLDTQKLVLSMNGYGRVRYYQKEQWRTWGNKRPHDSGFVATLTGDKKSLLIKDKSSTAMTAYSFVNIPNKIKVNGERGEITWRVLLDAGERKTIELAFAVGDDEKKVTSMANSWTSKFKYEFEAAKTKWEERWQASFTPGNKHFTGHFPILVTNDSKIRRVYYHGAIVPLLLCRTTFPNHLRFYVTASPRYANSLMYFWDTSMWANMWAMLDPAIMKATLEQWLSLDRYNCYAFDGMTGKGAGPWYAANDWTIFHCIDAYLGVTGDTSFLRKTINGKTVLQHLDEMATYFESRPLTNGGLLADYGGAENLLECSPSYIRGVPSLNAANVYMLKQTSEYQKRFGDVDRGRALQEKADKLLPEVMSLYKSGEGVWCARDKNGNEVPIRHCFDYITVGQALEKELSLTQKSEMNRFVETELLTKTWMRAMSHKDPAASKSDRPDHGPMGSYDGWPPMTMDVMCRFGAFDKALAFLRATEAISHQGPWAQSHEFLGSDSLGYDPILRTASRGGQDALTICGAAFAEVIIGSLFGFRPDSYNETPTLLFPKVPRGFEGKLLHVPYHDSMFEVKSDYEGLRLKKED